MPAPFLLTVQSQVHLQRAPSTISQDDWAWLREKRDLILGVVDRDQAPFDLLYRDGSYKGITADVSSLVAQFLGLQIRLVAFPDKDAALRALADKKIDVIGSARASEAQADLLSSAPYVTDKIALFRRTSDTREFAPDLHGLTVAVADKAIAAAAAKQYPEAKIVTYETADQAMAALGFGHSDAYLEGVLTAYYRINGSFYGYVVFDRFADMSIHYRYVFNPGNERLRGVVDEAIAAIGGALPEIARSWVGSGFIPDSKNVAFTPDELRWIAAHPRLRLVINDDLAPVAFFNDNGHFGGLASDLLEMVSFQTGLKFDVVSRRGSFPDQIDLIEEGGADIGIMTATDQREKTLRFTKPIANDPLVLVMKRGAGGAEAAENPRRIAIADGHVATALLSAHYPHSEITYVDSSLDALNMVNAGDADAGIMSLPSARYYSNRLFGDGLAISDMLDVVPIGISFAVRRSDAELQSILDKTLAVLTPYQFSAFTNRWKAIPGMAGETWRDYATIIVKVVVAAAVLLLIALAWAMSLRRTVRVKVQAKQLLKDQLQFVRTLIDSMPPPIYVRDTKGRMLACNRSYLDSVGLSAEDVMGRTATDLPSGTFEAAEYFHTSYLQAMRTGESITGVHNVRLHGNEIWMEHWIQPFQDYAGVNSGVICGWIDITAHRNLIQELETAKDEALAASRAKTTFLATMSHEIRTPMSAIIGTLELALKRADTQPIDRQSVQIAYASAQSLLLLIGDILDIVRIESGRLSLFPVRANLREQVESAARIFDGLARQKGLNLMLEIDAEAQTDVLMDALRFKQILSNLIGNAINHTETGFVRIRVQVVEAEPSVLQVSVSVEDSGIGISNEDQQRLFRPFVQVQGGSQAARGTGLGLVISRSLCEMMGGRLTLSSVLGRGTTVTADLRVQKLETVALSSKPVAIRTQAERKLRVLVVDDHSVNRLILMQQLGFLGHDVEEAPDGASALRLFEAGAFDVIFTDCRMPGMSGAELASAIRQAEHLSGVARSLIIGITADAQPEEIERCVQAGMDECLVKPVGLDALAARLVDIAPQANDAPPADASTALFDLVPLQEVTGGDVDRQGRLLNELIRVNREDAQRLVDYAKNGDVSQIAEIAHRIKGAANMVRAEAVVQACSAVEQACAVGPNGGTSLASAVEGLRLALQQLERALVQLRDRP
ncbi:ATP-binding protein [Achromobacter pestifer]|uniref:ATP-binding protein n=1 Tax=Achromobacter pestifer TaxID=1353889 RepID=UPI001C2E7BA4|nr:transporter substrate-binding domain-containing protein [Achromobacter pestifer]